IDKNGSGQAARTQQHTVRTAAAPKVKTLKGLHHEPLRSAHGAGMTATGGSGVIIDLGEHESSGDARDEDFERY
ncbi:MAG TPA: hypothetical protein PLW83_04805, partial [Deltaproteobacteria bacterium]|nr:hypothetical protein [Deltaproteobacteria bacterium]